MRHVEGARCYDALYPFPRLLRPPLTPLHMSSEDKEFVIFAVKLLIERLEEGKVKLVRDRVPHAVEALKAVRFDEQGNPIFETITGPVRAMANFVFHTEAKASEKEIEERERNSPVHDLIGQPVAVDDEVLKGCAKERRFDALAFELYKETATVLTVCSHSYISLQEDERPLTRNQAIGAGLLVRIVKFMIAVMDLSAEQDRGEIVLARNRCIEESAVNLRYLLMKNEEKYFDQFVRFSLGTERELYDIIQRNIADRGGKKLPIEQRMLKSIARTCEISGVPIEEIDPKFKDWGGGVRNRLKALGQGDLYVSLRLGSHAIHGTWVDLWQRNLEEKDGGFIVEPRFSRVDSRLLLPICFIVLQAGESYIDFFFGELPDVRPLRRRMEDLQARVSRVDNAAEAWLSSKRRPKGGSPPSKKSRESNPRRENP